MKREREAAEKEDWRTQDKRKNRDWKKIHRNQLFFSPSRATRVTIELAKKATGFATTAIMDLMASAYRERMLKGDLPPQFKKILIRAEMDAWVQEQKNDKYMEYRNFEAKYWNTAYEELKKGNTGFSELTRRWADVNPKIIDVWIDRGQHMAELKTLYDSENLKEYEEKALEKTEPIPTAIENKPLPPIKIESIAQEDPENPEIVEPTKTKTETKTEQQETTEWQKIQLANYHKKHPPFDESNRIEPTIP